MATRDRQLSYIYNTFTMSAPLRVRKLIPHLAVWSDNGLWSSENPTQLHGAQPQSEAVARNSRWSSTEGTGRCRVAGCQLTEGSGGKPATERQHTLAVSGFEVIEVCKPSIVGRQTSEGTQLSAKTLRRASSNTVPPARLADDASHAEVLKLVHIA